ncbi:MarR family transcriptional regulator [Clostridium perfringens]|uniref:MarR family transcriptional regulator n=2 Tax=root TaxID=1 RepID=UPI001CCEC2CB|nr:helix-turn-helix domain-containing protein [Clostridium perfringens]
MKIKVGQKIKVNVVELKEKKEKFGVIEGIYEHHILINFGAMENKYLEHIAVTEGLKTYHYKVLMLLITNRFTQSEVSNILEVKKQNINKIFKELLDMGLIENSETIGRNKYFKAVTDIKKINSNIPGQIKFI